MYLIQLHKGYLWNKVNKTIIYLILLIAVLLELILTRIIIVNPLSSFQKLYLFYFLFMYLVLDLVKWGIIIV